MSHGHWYLWLQVGKSGPFTFGWQLTPQADLLNGGEKSVSSYLDKVHRYSSYAVSYSPEATTGGSPLLISAGFPLMTLTSTAWFLL